MKKIFTFFVVSCLFSTLCAQNFPDGSFENGWENFGDYYDYSSTLFYSLNELYEEPQVHVLTTFRDDNAQNGNFALRLESANPTICFIPGAIGTIKEDFIREFLDNGGLDMRRDFAFQQRPLGVKGYFKYEPVNGDSAAVEFAVFNGNTELGAAKFVEKNWIDVWTPFYVALNYSDQTTTLPNNVKLIFASSAGYNFENLQECVGQVGSKMWIDNVNFVYNEADIPDEDDMPSAISEVALTEVMVAPNPTSDRLTFHFGEEVHGEVTIYNMLGAKILNEQVNGATHSVSLANVEVGTYFYVLTSIDNVQNRGKIQVVR